MTGPLRRLEDTFPYRSTRHLRTLDGRRLTAKTRLGWWIAWNWDEWAYRHRWFPWFPDPLKRGLCRVWSGHTPIDDHCLDPAHRYCSWCGLRTPHAALDESENR